MERVWRGDRVWIMEGLGARDAGMLRRMFCYLVATIARFHAMRFIPGIRFRFWSNRSKRV